MYNTHKNSTNPSQNTAAQPSIKDIPMATSTKQTAAFITAKPLRPRNHHRSYYPSIKTGKTNPFARRSPSYRNDRKGRTKCEKVIYHQNEPISPPSTHIEGLSNYGSGSFSKSPLERGFRGVLLGVSREPKGSQRALSKPPARKVAEGPVSTALIPPPPHTPSPRSGRSCPRCSRQRRSRCVRHQASAGSVAA